MSGSVWRLDTAAPPSKRCRVAIVGGGMAGLELAKRLDAAGCDGVVVFEAGPGADLVHHNSALPADDALRMWLEPQRDPYFRRPWRSATPPYYDSGSGLRQRLGGRSLYWYGVILPIEPWAMTEPWWPAAVIRDLTDSWRGGASLYELTQQDLRQWASGGTPEPRTSADGEVSVGKFAMRTTPRATRASTLDSSRWHAYSPLDTWRDPDTGELIGEPPGVTMCVGAHVRAVTVESGSARGLLIAQNGTDYEVAADVVVLAGGTLENSRLAIQALSSTGNATRLPYLADHIVQGIFIRLTGRSAAALLAEVPAGSYYAPCEETLRSNVFLDIVSVTEQEILVDLRITGEQLPDVDSYVSCGSDGTVVHSQPSDEDFALIAGQRLVLQELWDTMAETAGVVAQRLDFGEYANPQRANAFVLPSSIRAASVGIPATWSSFLGTEDHEGGTLPLGGLLTEDNELRGIQRLYATGPSTFPRLGAANPSLTTLALARRLAHHLHNSH